MFMNRYECEHPDNDPRVTYAASAEEARTWYAGIYAVHPDSVEVFNIELHKAVLMRSRTGHVEACYGHENAILLALGPGGTFEGAEVLAMETYRSSSEAERAASQLHREHWCSVPT